jgi:hypothetical protein
MKPEYKVVTYTSDMQRVYYAYKYYDAVELLHIITRTLPYAELWEGTRLVQVYDAQLQLLS